MNAKKIIGVTSCRYWGTNIIKTLIKLKVTNIYCYDINTKKIKKIFDNYPKNLYLYFETTSYTLIWNMKFEFLKYVKIGLNCMEAIYTKGVKLDFALTLPDNIIG